MSDADEASERRRAERIPINTEFANMPSATYISDLSEYGVFVHTPTPSALGSRIKLRFTVLLDDPVIVEGEGRVVRHQAEPTPGMGIEFTGLEPEMILRINDVLSRQRPRDSGPPLPAHESLGALVHDDDDEDASETLTRGEAVGAEEVTGTDTLVAARRPAAASPGAAPLASTSGTFRPPPMPSRSPDEDARTGIYQPVEEAIDDSEH